MMERFFLTFGQQYARETHPAGSWVHPDGWVTIDAPNYNTARQLVLDLFGRQWSDLYAEASHDASFYPAGELLRITYPGGRS